MQNYKINEKINKEFVVSIEGKIKKTVDFVRLSVFDFIIMYYI